MSCTLRKMASHVRFVNFEICSSVINTLHDVTLLHCIVVSALWSVILNRQSYFSERINDHIGFSLDMFMKEKCIAKHCSVELHCIDWTNWTSVSLILNFHMLLLPVSWCGYTLVCLLYAWECESIEPLMHSAIQNMCSCSLRQAKIILKILLMGLQI